MLEIFEAYSRMLVDNHITEEKPSFMSKFDPAQYVAMMKTAGVDSSMVYACCHNGNCYYPTKVGHMHCNLNGRDIFGQTIDLLRRENIIPIAYYTAIFHNQSARDNPDWRQIDCLGQNRCGRFWYCCPNNYDYRNFAKAQLAEVVSYDISGIFIDMTFWPTVCFCDRCKKRYTKESNANIPQTLDWNDPVWVSFQRTREKWLNEFAHDITNFIKSQRSDISVVHQFSPVMLGWLYGQNSLFQKASDYSSGDFYGGKDQQRVAVKVFSAFSRNIPFEFMTSRCVSLLDHTSTKSTEEMICSAATSYANGGASFFIDAINPDGTLEPALYEKLGTVNKTLLPFNKKLKELKPEIIADVGLYFSMASNVKWENCGKELKTILDPANNMQPISNIQPIKELQGTSIILCNSNIPYKIITEQTTDLSDIKTLIINNAAFMTKDETERIRQFVKNGGVLIATGKTSLYNELGQSDGDFALKDVFGVCYQNNETQKFSYLVSDKDDIISCDYPAALVKATTADVLAKVSQPDFPPFDKDHYASIHSNPPGKITNQAALTVNKFGKGRCIYLYSSLLVLQQHAQQSFGQQFFSEYVNSEMIVESNAPASVEITILKNTKSNSYLLCFVNYQAQLPNIQIHNIKTTFKLPKNINISSCTCVSTGKDFQYEADGQNITIKLKKLETIEMMELTF